MKKSELKALIKETMDEMGQVPYQQLPQEYKELLGHMDKFFQRRPSIGLADMDAIKGSFIRYLMKNGWKKSL